MYHWSPAFFLVFAASLVCQIHGLNGTDYCEDGICSYVFTLQELCSGFEGQANSTQLQECLCGNGYKSTNVACAWCQEALNLPVAEGYIPDILSATSSCSSIYATIAPIPSSILASMSTWNMSYSSFLATAVGSAGQGGTISGSGLPTQSAAGSLGPSWTSTYTFAGSDAPSGTISGGTEPTSTGSSTGSNTGGAKGWRTISRVAVIMGLLCFGVSVLCIL